MSTPTPNQEEDKAETMAEKIQLTLKELKFTVTKDSVIIETTRTPAELTYKEWRVVKTFIDNIFSEMRTRAR